MKKKPVQTNYSDAGEGVVSKTELELYPQVSFNYRPYHANRVPYNDIFTHYLPASSWLPLDPQRYVCSGVDSLEFTTNISNTRVFILDITDGGKYRADMITVPPSGKLIFDVTPELFFAIELNNSLFINFIKFDNTYGDSL